MFSLNESQIKVVEAAEYWYYNSSELVFQYTGAAGTGKSVVLNEIIKRLDLNQEEILPMSFTGTAALVMRSKGLSNAKTIHSSIYEVYEKTKIDEFGHVVMDTYFNKPKIITGFRKKDSLPGIKLILIDEASMTPRSIVRDIESFGIKIIACGDLNQLPPVGDDPGFLVSGNVYRLDTIMRQKEKSGIIYLANRAIQGLPIQYGAYGDVFVIDQDQLSDDILFKSDIVLTCRNSTRDKFNRYMRERLLGETPSIPRHGEPVICRKNNWSIESNGINLVNGLRGEVNNFPDVGSIKGKVFYMNFLVDGAVLFNDLDCDYEYFKAPFEKKNALRNSPYAPGNKFELAYAITTHLSQGSQYGSGVFIEEFLNKNIMKNLIYTGITRFFRKLIYVKPARKFY